MRTRVNTDGWGAHLLALRDPDGQWDGLCTRLLSDPLDDGGGWNCWIDTAPPLRRST